MINSFKNYLVEEDRSTFFTFGRMNPPTIGHEKLLKVLSQKAGKNPYKIYLSQSTDQKKNPLDYQQKIKIARKMFPKYARSIMLDRKVKTVFDVVTKLHSEGSKKVTMVVGSDRIREFEVLLAKYNGVKGRHGFYHFENIDVVSAGDRDPDADDASGMSASKMRAAAKENNFTQFSQGLPRNVNNNDAKQIYNSVRSGMGLKEQREFKNHIQLKPVSDVRESYVSGKLYEVDDIVLIKETGETAKIKHLGSNHVIVENNDITARKWLTDIEKVQDYKVKVASFKESLDEQSMLNKLIQKLRLSNKLEKLVRLYLNYRRDNPGQGRKGVIQFVRRLGPQYNLRDADHIIKAMNQLVATGKLPKHLAINETTVSQDPDIKDREGTQPAKYHSGLSKSTKAARDRQFKKQTKMADDNPAAYKPAPGDKNAKTKPSKYTTAVNKMFGEQDATKLAKKRIDREKEKDKVKHDRMMDRARMRDTIKKNRETNPNDKV